MKCTGTGLVFGKCCGLYRKRNEKCKEYVLYNIVFVQFHTACGLIWPILWYLMFMGCSIPLYTGVRTCDTGAGTYCTCLIVNLYVYHDFGGMCPKLNGSMSYNIVFLQLSCVYINYLPACMYQYSLI